MKADLYIDEIKFVRGDVVTICVLFNDLTGANHSTPELHESYMLNILPWLIINDKITLMSKIEIKTVEGTIFAKGFVGDRTRVNSSSFKQFMDAL
jgi:hypothetical protein